MVSKCSLVPLRTNAGSRVLPRSCSIYDFWMQKLTLRYILTAMNFGKSSLPKSCFQDYARILLKLFTWHLDKVVIIITSQKNPFWLVLCYSCVVANPVSLPFSYWPQLTYNLPSKTSYWRKDKRGDRSDKKLLDDLKDRRGYSHLKEEALDRNMWRDRSGRGFEPVVRRTAGWWWFSCSNKIAITQWVFPECEGPVRLTS